MTWKHAHIFNLYQENMHDSLSRPRVKEEEGKYISCASVTQQNRSEKWKKEEQPQLVVQLWL